MQLRIFRVMWLMILITITLTSSKLYGQPGRPPSILISTVEKIFENSIATNNLSFTAFAFNDSTQYYEVINLDFEERQGQSIIDNLIIREIWYGVPRGTPYRLDRSSILMVTMVDSSVTKLESNDQMMNVFIRMAYRPSWRDEIKLTHLDSFYIGDFFYDMCQPELNETCQGNYEWFPKIYDNKGRMVGTFNQVLDLSCIENHRIPEGSILEIIRKTKCDDLETIRRLWTE